jgi:hypothetical protein
MAAGAVAVRARRPLDGATIHGLAGPAIQDQSRPTMPAGLRPKTVPAIAAGNDAVIRDGRAGQVHTGAAAALRLGRVAAAHDGSGIDQRAAAAEQHAGAAGLSGLAAPSNDNAVIGHGGVFDIGLDDHASAAIRYRRDITAIRNGQRGAVASAWAHDDRVGHSAADDRSLHKGLRPLRL